MTTHPINPPPAAGEGSMSTWNQNMAAAPKSRGVTRTTQTTKGERTYNEIQHEYVILNTKCAKALRSYWIPDEQRWAGLAKGEEPIAWMHWPKPLQLETESLVDEMEYQRGAEEEFRSHVQRLQRESDWS